MFSASLPVTNRNFLQIIILTGKKDQNVVATASRLGVNNVLSKPFTPSGLKMAIESIVGALN